MKKLMIAAAIVCAAALTQAASVKWDSATMYTVASADGGFSSTKASGSAYSALFFSLTADQYSTYLAAYNTSGDMSKVYADFKDASGTSMTLGRGGNFNTTTTANVNDTVYGAVLFTTSATFDGVIKDYYIANIGSGTVGSEAGITIGNLATYYLGTSAGTATGGWQAVPEPTSGLLLLLGMAGLALKRKVA